MICDLEYFRVFRSEKHRRTELSVCRLTNKLVEYVHYGLFIMIISRSRCNFTLKFGKNHDIYIKDWKKESRWKITIFQIHQKSARTAGARDLYTEVSVVVRKKISTGRIYKVGQIEDNSWETIYCDKCGWKIESTDL